MKTDYCFCTLALGKQYRFFANELAEDLDRFAPGVTFLILTDKPSDFHESPVRLIFKHVQKGVMPYHDKRFALQKALRLFETAIWIDCNSRIYDNIPSMSFEPGLTMLTGWDFQKWSQEILPKIRHQNSKKLFSKIIRKFDLEETSAISVINEMLFAVKKDGFSIKDFIEKWDFCSKYLELRGLFVAEGASIGIAAKAVNMPIHFRSEDNFQKIAYLKDIIVSYKLQKGTATLLEQRFYEQRKRIEFPVTSLYSKVCKYLLKKMARIKILSKRAILFVELLPRYKNFFS